MTRDEKCGKIKKRFCFWEAAGRKKSRKENGKNSCKKGLTNSKECVKLEKLSTRTAHRTLKIKQREKDKIGTRNEFEKTFWYKLKQYFRKREVDSKKTTRR